MVDASTSVNIVAGSLTFVGIALGIFNTEYLIAAILILVTSMVFGMLVAFISWGIMVTTSGKSTGEELSAKILKCALTGVTFGTILGAIMAGLFFYRRDVELFLVGEEGILLGKMTGI